MTVMKPPTVVALVAGLLVRSVATQTVLQEQILSSVVFTLYGDRTPLVLPQNPTLTPLGAQQLYDAGSNFRNRYISSSNGSNADSTSIFGISPYILDNSEVSILSTSDQHVVASTTAFLQGLYPPLEISNGATFETDLSILANGSEVQAPLSNYQYPQFYTASPLDVNSIWIAGSDSCPIYTSSSNQYWESPEYLGLLDANAEFYASLVPGVLDGIFPNASVGYFDAYNIWDYVQYGVTHNSTVADAVTDADFLRLKVLADTTVFAMDANLTASGTTAGDHIRAIAGSTLATKIVESLYENINTSGGYNKLTLLFGSFEPMISFFALAGLQDDVFGAIPEFGASIVIELFTLYEEGTSSAGYPSDTSGNLFVRFLYQNGTGDDARLTQYPLFGQDPNNMYVSLSDFVAGMEPIMLLSIEQWCSACGSYSIWCPAFEETNSGGSDILSSSNHGLSPVIAGVIGALVTLVVLALIVGAAMLLLGLRFFRVKNKRRSELAGFKGAEKLASDQDLTIPKGGAGAVVTEGAAAPSRGHERVGSWELKDSGPAEAAQQQIDHVASGVPRRASFEDDEELHVNPYSNPVKPKDQL